MRFDKINYNIVLYSQVLRAGIESCCPSLLVPVIPDTF